MEIADFIEVTKEIEKFYGTEEKPRTLNTTESQIWLEELNASGVTKERYRQLARECFKVSQYMPKLATIMELHRTIPKERKKETENFEKQECHFCFGDGIFDVSYEVNGKTYSFAAKCICDNAKKYPNFVSIRNLGIYKDGYGEFKPKFGNTDKYKLRQYVFYRIRDYFNKQRELLNTPHSSENEK